MDCPRCGAPNPEGKRYCGECGAPLRPEAPGPALSDAHLTSRIQAVLQEHLKDRKLVEIELTEAIVTRLSNWAKLLGFFVGIPLAALAVVLGILGVRNYSDFSRTIDTAKTDIEQTFHRAQQHAQQQADVFKQRADALKKESDDLALRGEDLKARYQKLQSELAGIDALSENVRTLAKKVERIEERIGFEASPALTPILKKQLDASFAAFMRYLTSIGFAPNDRVQIRVDSETETNAHFDPGGNRIVIGEALARDTHVVYRTYTHYALGTFIKLSEPAAAVESGLADYFPCSFSDNPLFGEESARVLRLKGMWNKAYLRTLDNPRKFSELGPRPESHDAGEVWGAAFWDIRRALGREVTDKLLFSTWASFKGSDARPKFEDLFVEQLLGSARTRGGAGHADQVRSIFERRGRPLSPP
jgi:hypothetical protein